MGVKKNFQQFGDLSELNFVSVVPIAESYDTHQLFGRSGDSENW